MNKPMNEAVAEFLTMLRARNVSFNTRKTYGTALEQLSSYMGTNADLQRFDRITVSQFLEHLHAKGLVAKSQRLKLNGVRAFSRWAKEEGMIPQDYAQSVRGPRIPSTPPESPTESTVTRLLDGPLPEGSSTFEARDRVILEMLYGACGIRVAELTKVNLKDFEGKDLLKVRGKGGRERYVIVGVRARDALAKYLPVREKLLARIENDALLIGISNSRRGGRMDVRSVSRVVRKIADAKGMPTLTCHSLRHAFGQTMYDNGASLPAVQRLLGHARLATTAGFYVDGSVKRMRREIVQAHPHAKVA